MRLQRIEEATRLIDIALQEVLDQNVAITNVLFRCQAIARLLNIEAAHSWATLELEGYESAEDRRGNTERPKKLPSYREVQLISELSQPETIPVGWYNYAPDEHIVRPFWVISSCTLLENTEKGLHLLRAVAPRSSPILYVLYANLGQSGISAILGAVRSRAHDFLMQQRIAVSFTPLMEHLFEGTKNLVIDKLREVDPDLLDEVVIMLDRQQQGGNELDWRSAADACRNVVQRFTEILMTDEILKPNEPRPDEDDTVGKTSLVVNFVRTRLVGKKGDTDIAHLSATLDYFFNYFKSLKAVVEKTKHKPMTAVEKDEVDRAVAYVFLWMADVIRLLDRARFDWSKAKSHEAS